MSRGQKQKTETLTSKKLSTAQLKMLAASERRTRASDGRSEVFLPKHGKFVTELALERRGLCRHGHLTRAGIAIARELGAPVDERADVLQALTSVGLAPWSEDGES